MPQKIKDVLESDIGSWLSKLFMIFSDTISKIDQRHRKVQNLQICLLEIEKKLIELQNTNKILCIALNIHTQQTKSDHETNFMCDVHSNVSSCNQDVSCVLYNSIQRIIQYKLPSDTSKLKIGYYMKNIRVLNLEIENLELQNENLYEQQRLLEKQSKMRKTLN